jgi:hypothetical protein
VPKGSKVCFWHLWVGPVLSSKQEESWERTKRIVSTTAVQSLTLFWTHLIVGHLFTWQQPKHKVLPTTKSCDILDVTMTGLVWAIPTPTKHGCCTFHCYVFTTLSFKMMGCWNFSSWKQQKMKPNLATSSCGMIAKPTTYLINLKNITLLASSWRKAETLLGLASGSSFLIEFYSL